MLTLAGIYESVELFGSIGSPVEFGWIAYGTGTTAEGTALTALTTEVDREAATIEIISVYAPHDTMRFYYLFTAAAAYAVTEIAVFNAASGGDMLGRKLLTDDETPYLVSVEKNGFLLAIYDFSIQNAESLPA